MFFVYLDDLLVTSQDHKTHKKHLRILFARLSEYGIIIGPQKCQFGTTELSFLGHHVCAAGISPLPSAVDAIVNFVKPEKQRALRRYLGMVNQINITCDASDVAVGGVLQQFLNGMWQPLSFFSKKLSPAETMVSLQRVRS